jgi:hypothetical protein
MIRALVFALALAPMFVQAQDAQLFRRAKTSCSARAIDRFYCPWFSDQFQGPYFDNGCSVTCKNGQRAVCLEATCDSNQSGEPVYSRCECR